MGRLKGSRNGSLTLVELVCKRCSKCFKVEPNVARSGRQYCSITCKNYVSGLSLADYNKIRRQSFKDRGMCSNCGIRPPGETQKCEECREKFKISSRVSGKKNQKTRQEKARLKLLDPIEREKINACAKQRRKKLRSEILDLLGGKCVCCGETNKIYLQVDHLNKDGKQHRALCNNDTYTLFKDIKKNPSRFELRVLCASCHFAFTQGEQCQHPIVLNIHERYIYPGVKE